MSPDERMREMPKDDADGSPVPGDEAQDSCMPAADGPMTRRSITLVKNGTQFAQSMRLCTAADLGQVIKPFVCMEHEQLSPYERPGGRLRPFSGVAVLTLVLSGAAEFDDTTGNKGRLAAGGVAWLVSGRGVWQAAALQSQEITRIFRVGIALRSSSEDLSARSRYIAPCAVPQEGPVRVVLGRLGTMGGALDKPEDIYVFQCACTKGNAGSTPHHWATRSVGSPWIADDCSCKAHCRATLFKAANWRCSKSRAGCSAHVPKASHLL